MKFDEMIEDCDIIFDNPEARIPLSLVSREDLYLLMRSVVEETIRVLEEDDGGTHHSDLLMDHFGM